MTRAELQQLFPNASPSCFKVNSDAGNPRSHPIVECPVVHDPLEANPREERAAGKLHIRFISWRQRLCDPDNLSVKWLLDCLRYCGAIEGDEPEKIRLEVTQQKVKLKSNERTEIVIEAYE